MNEQKNKRPLQVVVGAGIFTAFYLYGMGTILLQPVPIGAEASNIAWLLYLHWVCTPIILFGLWIGVGAARFAELALILGRIISFIAIAMRFPTLNAGMTSVSVLFLIVEAAALVALYWPASNAWYRARNATFRKYRAYPIIFASLIVFGVPILILLMFGGSFQLVPIFGKTFFLVVPLLINIPGMLVGEPHFATSMFGWSPVDETGNMITAAFYLLLALALVIGIAALIRRRGGGAIRNT